MKITVLIPVLNEADNIGRVIADIPQDLNAQIVVVDNGSTDGTPKIAKQAGATVLYESRRGYGSACLKGLAYLSELPLSEQPDVVVFIDGDYSDYPEEMPLLLQPISEGQADLVIGSRNLGGSTSNAMTVPQRFGNFLATRLLGLFYGAKFTDLGPFRAIRWQTLQALDMQDQNFGWTVEMQLKAVKQGFTTTEVSVRYRKRASGKSKISGTVKGTFLAGYVILKTIFKHR